MLVYPDDTPIAPSDMVEELRKTRKPLNWVLCIISLLEKHGRRMTGERTRVEGLISYENMRDIETNTKETARVSSEIERAKREGNVAEEERLKVQMTRLADERVKLDSTRREIEHEEEAAAAAIEGAVHDTPEYTSSTPVGGEGDAQRVRGAVASFNSKMLEKYGEDDANIPTSEPPTPRSPAYSSIFEGGGHRSEQRGGGKFIPQIPNSVLDNYLSSRYGISSTQAQAATQSGPAGIMTGGTNTSGGFGIPTMNIPVVATMPMAGMMPMQQPQQPQQQQQAGGGASIQQGGQSASSQAGVNEPNAQGVKTLSLKL
jgi:hypothetical protein